MVYSPMILGLLLFSSPAVHAWSPAEEKTVEELNLMNEHALAYEASAPCLDLTFGNLIHQQHPNSSPPTAGQSRDYLQTIGRVARKFNNGSDPAWYAKVFTASSGTDGRACSVYGEVQDDGQSTPPARKPTPQKKKRQ